jgi:hypothetical protein
LIGNDRVVGAPAGGGTGVTVSNVGTRDEGVVASLTAIGVPNWTGATGGWDRTGSADATASAADAPPRIQARRKVGTIEPSLEDQAIASRRRLLSAERKEANLATFIGFFAAGVQDCEGRHLPFLAASGTARTLPVSKKTDVIAADG